MNTRELIETRLKPAQELSNLWDKQVRDEFATKDARAPLDTMTPGAYVNRVPDGTFERRFCGVLVALIWVITNFVIAFVL